MFHILRSYNAKSNYMARYACRPIPPRPEGRGFSGFPVSTGTGTRNIFQELGKPVVFATNLPDGAKRMRYMRIRKARFATSAMIMNATK